MSRWAVASKGGHIEVKELALKGTGEARCRPSRGRAWLRGHLVRANEAGVNLREKAPLPRDILHRLVGPTRMIGAATEAARLVDVTRLPRLVYPDGQPKGGDRPPALPWPRSGDRSARAGLWANRHLHDLVEFILGHVGGPRVEVSRPPLKLVGVGGAIVLGARASRVPGAGSQGIDAPSYAFTARVRGISGTPSEGCRR
jgi:hypothetical protein